MKILIRQFRQDDENFIYATYLRHNWFSKTNTTTLKRKTWSSLHHNRIEQIMARQAVLVACLSEDQDTILGYAFKDGSAPFVYVKLPFRNESFKVREKLLKELSNEVVP